jgi:hypothetical protein
VHGKSDERELPVRVACGVAGFFNKKYRKRLQKRKTDFTPATFQRENHLNFLTPYLKVFFYGIILAPFHDQFNSFLYVCIL